MHSGEAFAIQSRFLTKILTDKGTKVSLSGSADNSTLFTYMYSYSSNRGHLELVLTRVTTEIKVVLTETSKNSNLKKRLNRNS